MISAASKTSHYSGNLTSDDDEADALRTGRNLQAHGFNRIHISRQTRESFRLDTLIEKGFGEEDSSEASAKSE